ncbi:hypothetical protein ACOME3_001044 [Neoechinorhynchus agilis]
MKDKISQRKNKNALKSRIDTRALKTNLRKAVLHPKSDQQNNVEINEKRSDRRRRRIQYKRYFESISSQRLEAQEQVQSKLLSSIVEQNGTEDLKESDGVRTITYKTLKDVDSIGVCQGALELLKKLTSNTVPRVSQRMARVKRIQRRY